MSFANMKKNNASALQGLQAQVQQSLENQNGGVAKDPRFWKHTYDKTTKVGSAVIRFLPFGDGERLPWASWQGYNFKTAAGSYWNRSRVTIGQPDPMAEINKTAWARNLAGDQNGCKDRTIKKRFVANIVVISDPANPQNNGQNFLYEYGPSIQDLILAKMAPKYEDQAKVPVFDWWKGANFELRSCEDKKFLSYKDSTFAPAGPLHPDDAVLEKIYNGMHDLVEFEKEEGNYKSYDDLKADAIKVLGARFVAGIFGEEFSPEAAAQSGGNPFGQAQQQAQKQAAPQGNPFGQQQAAVSNEPAAAGNPFEQQAASNEPAAAGNPFEQQAASTENVAADPFANIPL